MSLTAAGAASARGWSGSRHLPLRPGIAAALILLHTGLSEPAPQYFHIEEALAGLCLCLLAGIRRPFAIFSGQLIVSPARDLPIRLAGFSFLLLLWTGLLGGIANAHPAEAALRDIIPLVFLYLPLWLLKDADGQPYMMPTLLPLLVLGGGLFACRYLLDAGFVPSVWRELPVQPDSGYLANSPLLAFAAVAGIGISVMRPGRMAWRLLLPAAAAWLTLALSVQRAPFILSLAAAAGVMACLVLGGARRGQRLRSALLALAILGALLTLTVEASPFLLEKTRLVGGNARLAEWSAIWFEVSGSLPELLFGRGWGASFASPAVGFYEVGYAHGLLGYILLKTGVSGLAALMLYLLALGIWLVRCFKRVPVIAIVVLPPLLSALLLYTSYKYLGLGLLLWLLAEAARPRADLPSRSA